MSFPTILKCTKNIVNAVQANKLELILVEVAQG